MIYQLSLMLLAKCREYSCLLWPLLILSFFVRYWIPVSHETNTCLATSPVPEFRDEMSRSSVLIFDYNMESVDRLIYKEPLRVSQEDHESINQYITPHGWMKPILLLFNVMVNIMNEIGQRVINFYSSHFLLYRKTNWNK